MVELSVEIDPAREVGPVKMMNAVNNAAINTAGKMLSTGGENDAVPEYFDREMIDAVKNEEGLSLNYLEPDSAD